MRAATLTSLAVLGLSTLAIATVGAEGQRTRHHRTTGTMSNSTDMPANGATTNTPIGPDSSTPMMNGTTTPDGTTMNNGM